MQIEASRVVQPPKIVNPTTLSPHRMPKAPIIIHQANSPIKYTTHMRSISAPRFQQVFYRVPTVVQRVITGNHAPVQSDHHRAANIPTSNDIRKRLDENLKRAYEEINDKNYNFEFGSNKTAQSMQLHRNRLEKKLVEEYIQLIYRDYSIKDPLAPRIHGSSVYRIEGSTATEPNRGTADSRRKGQSVMSGSTNKRAVELK